MPAPTELATAHSTAIHANPARLATLDALAPIGHEFGELLAQQDDLERTLDQAFSELHRWRRDLLEQQERLNQQRTELERDREAIQNREPTSDVEASLASLAAARADLSETQRQLESLNLELERVAAENNAINTERSELETELEHVRVRAAELAEAVSEARRQLVEQRLQSARELQALRVEVERLATQGESAGTAAPAVVEHEPTEPLAPAAGNPVGKSAKSRPEDAVLGSVIAQFQKLRSDRRTGRTATKA